MVIVSRRGGALATPISVIHGFTADLKLAFNVPAVIEAAAIFLMFIDGFPNYNFRHGSLYFKRKVIGFP